MPDADPLLEIAPPRVRDLHWRTARLRNVVVPLLPENAPETPSE